MDTLGQAQLGSANPDPVSTKSYPMNPYLKASKTVPNPQSDPMKSVDNADLEPLPSEPMVEFLPHLIAALVSAVDKSGQEQQAHFRQQLADWLPQLPARLNPAIEQYLDKVVPKVVKVDQPGRTVLLLVRYLTVGMVVAGLAVGGLFFAWLHARQERDAFAPGYWQYRYLKAKTIVDRSAAIRRLLTQTDTLFSSPTFSDELTRLENIVDARQQQYNLQIREASLLHSTEKRSKIVK